MNHRLSIHTSHNPFNNEMGAPRKMSDILKDIIFEIRPGVAEKDRSGLKWMWDRSLR